MQVVIVKPNPFGSGQQKMVFTFLFFIIYFLSQPVMLGIQYERSGGRLVRKQICSIKEFYILFLLQSLLKFIEKATGQSGKEDECERSTMKTTTIIANTTTTLTTAITTDFTIIIGSQEKYIKNQSIDIGSCGKIVICGCGCGCRFVIVCHLSTDALPQTKEPPAFQTGSQAYPMCHNAHGHHQEAERTQTPSRGQQTPSQYTIDPPPPRRPT